MSSKKAVYRLLDANLNRAREGLRVIEDSARFVFEKPSIYRESRRLRHRLDQSLRNAYPALVLSRESVRDPGRTIPEFGRRDLQGLLSANLKRVGEALRVLEEYSKVFSPRAASSFKACRYKLYDLETKVIKMIRYNR